MSPPSGDVVLHKRIHNINSELESVCSLAPRHACVSLIVVGVVPFRIELELCVKPGTVFIFLLVFVLLCVCVYTYYGGSNATGETHLGDFSSNVRACVRVVRVFVCVCISCVFVAIAYRVINTMRRQPSTMGLSSSSSSSAAVAASAVVSNEMEVTIGNVVVVEIATPSTSVGSNCSSDSSGSSTTTLTLGEDVAWQISANSNVSDAVDGDGSASSKIANIGHSAKRQVSSQTSVSLLDGRKVPHQLQPKQDMK